MDQFTPPIFKFEDSTTGKGLTVRLQGSASGPEWYAQEPEVTDLAFYEEVLSQDRFKGKLKAIVAGKPVSTAEELLMTSIAAWQGKNPYGAMTAFSKEGEKIGILMLSLGDEPGAATVIGYPAAGKCGLGLGADSVRVIVKQFAPEVRRIGQEKESFKIHGAILAKLYAKVPPKAKEMFEELGFKVSESNSGSSEGLTRYELVLQ